MGALDYAATRRELLALLRDQAASLRQTVAAAVVWNRNAVRVAEAQLAARLLDNARLLAELDRRGALTDSFLDATLREHDLFRVSVLAADGSFEGGGAAEGRARRGAGRGRGFGGRGGFGLGSGHRGRPGGPGAYGGLVDRLLAGGEQEVSTDVHASRWGNEARLAAGVRRAGGGAIVLNADATAVARLTGRSSLDALLADVVRNAGDVAYVVLPSASVIDSTSAGSPTSPRSTRSSTTGS